MCLAIPARVVALLDDDMATVEIGGVQKRISISLVEGIEVDDYVIVHTGFALSKLDPEEAQQTLELFAEMSALVEEASSR